MSERTQSSSNARAEFDAADVHRRRGMFFIGMAVGCVGFAMALQLGLNANFLADDMDLEPDQIGRLEAVREMCGIAAFVVVAMLAGAAEPVVGAGVLVFFGAGLGCYFFMHDYLWIVLASLVWSQGLHVWMPLPYSMTLSLAEPGRSGYRLGQIQAAGAVGFAAGLVSGFVVTLIGLQIRPLYLLAENADLGMGQVGGLAIRLLGMPIRPLYLAAGAVALVGAAACLGIPRKIKTPGPRLVLKRRYSLYYLLSFMEGWRKQISFCFAGFLLVRVYGTRLEVMLLLWGAVQAIGYFSAPGVGRLIDRIGERRIMVFYFACLTAFFVGYTTVSNVYVLYALFVADNAFFVFVMALNTYVNRIAPENELTPTLSMGVAVGHVASVMMPLIGGALWQSFGYRWPFLVGAGAAALSIPAALRIPPRSPAETP